MMILILIRRNKPFGSFLKRKQTFFSSLFQRLRVHEEYQPGKGHKVPEKAGNDGLRLIFIVNLIEQRFKREKM